MSFVGYIKKYGETLLTEKTRSTLLPFIFLLFPFSDEENVFKESLPYLSKSIYLKYFPFLTQEVYSSSGSTKVGSPQGAF